MRNYTRRLLLLLVTLALTPLATQVRADIIVVDNEATNSSQYIETPAAGETGCWNCGSNLDNYAETDFNDDAAYNGDSSATAQWLFSNLADGDYDVYAHWVYSPNRTTAAVYSISDGGGTCTIDQTQPEAQDLSITDDRSVSHWFQKLGSVTITDGTLDVTLSFTGGYAIADAIAIKSAEVPEPSTLALLMAAATCLVFTQRRRHSR